MIQTKKNIVWNVLLAALVAVLFTACPLKQGNQRGEDDETQIINKYFLPNNEHETKETLEASFRCGDIENNKAIENIQKFYDAIDPGVALNEFANEKVQGDWNDPKDERRVVWDKWIIKMTQDSIASLNLAYEYAVIQHWIYLKYPESIPPGRIQDFYNQVKAGSIPDCLIKNAQIAKNTNSKNHSWPKTNNRTEHNNEGQGEGNGTDRNLILICILGLFIVFVFMFGFRNQLGVFLQNNIERLYGRPNLPNKFEKPNKYELTSNKDILNEKSLSINEREAKKIEQQTKVEPCQETSSSTSRTELGKEPNLEKHPIAPLLVPNKPELLQTESTSSAALYYARIPSGNLFFGFSPQPDFPDTPFIINELNGTFDLVNDKDTLTRLFTAIDQLKDACELLNINQPNLQTYEVLAKGEVVREGEYWRITKKLKLDWK